MSEASDPLDDLVATSWRKRSFASLAYPQFRFFWLSNLVVALGLMVQFTARAWLVVRLTDSALVLGVIEGLFAVTLAGGAIPMGLVADRFNRRNLLLLDNVVALLAAAAIGVLVITDLIAIWHMIIASLLGGLLFAIRMPTSQAMTARLVPPAQLMNATSLSSASHSLPNVVGPAIGGVLVGGVGISVAYFATTGAYLVALIMLALGVAASFGAVERVENRSVTADLREGWGYLAKNKDLLKLTAAMLIPFVLGQSYVLLLPLFVDQELGRGAATFGALSASLGIGGVIGSMTVATFGQRRQIGYVMLIGVGAVGVAALIYGTSQWPLFTGIALVIAGAGESAVFAAFQTYLLIRVPDAIRGRVMGLTFTMVGFFPISAIVAGALADIFGLRAVAIVEGLLILALAPIAWRVVLRHIVNDRSLDLPAT